MEILLEIMMIMWGNGNIDLLGLLLIRNIMFFLLLAMKVVLTVHYFRHPRSFNSILNFYRWEKRNK